MTISTVLCTCAVDDTSTIAQAGTSLQGTSLQGTSLQGTSLQGMSLQGHRFDGATLAGQPLSNVRVSRGELTAQRNGTTLRGTGLVDAHLLARAQTTGSGPPTSVVVEYRIAAIIPERPENDPTGTGHTFLYTLEQRVDHTETWQLACPADADGRSVAIPVAAIWNEHGDRVESTSMFTFGCTTGVIAKCYRWGYRPWVTGHGDLTTMHQTCTRLARADYCGTGTPHTHDNTKINVWDNLQPQPIQRHGLLPPPLMLFEAGWDTGGAVCLSHARWLLDDALLLAALCPDRLVPPGLLGTVCDTVPQVLGFNADAKMFNEAYLNLVAP